MHKDQDCTLYEVLSINVAVKRWAFSAVRPMFSCGVALLANAFFFKKVLVSVQWDLEEITPKSATPLESATL